MQTDLKGTITLEQFETGWSARYWSRKEDREVKLYAPNARAVATILTGIRPEPDEVLSRFVRALQPIGDEELPQPDNDCFDPLPPLAAQQVAEAFSPPGDHNVAVDDTRGGL